VQMDELTARLFKLANDPRSIMAGATSSGAGAGGTGTATGGGSVDEVTQMLFDLARKEKTAADLNTAAAQESQSLKRVLSSITGGSGDGNGSSGGSSRSNSSSASKAKTSEGDDVSQRLLALGKQAAHAAQAHEQKSTDTLAPGEVWDDIRKKAKKVEEAVEKPSSSLLEALKAAGAGPSPGGEMPSSSLLEAIAAAGQTPATASSKPLMGAASGSKSPRSGGLASVLGFLKPRGEWEREQKKKTEKEEGEEE